MALGEAAKLLARAGHVVVFTGAGISAESGVPTFRDALTGLWSRFDAQALATPQAFAEDPDLVWGWYEWRRRLVQRVRPNHGHLAVSRMAAHLPRLTVITQNVDDLHERAGSPAPLHLHGSLFTPRCASCSRPAPLPPPIPDDADAEGRRIPPPRCRHCTGPIRPGVVWFGEPLPEYALESAVRAASACDVLLTIGTSGLVYPAAEIPRLAARAGAAVLQINPQPTPLDPIATVNLPGPAAEILPTLVDTTWP
ncbi:NAD-dependent deacetylase [Actinoplanes sp. SE50]|uniref:SIR2 family NAD-dependent protein deacylase n=1 Tax=unclassified Actinoplanes TaxID=2626549 RepID=UPI00023EC4E6|nr:MULTISPECIES: NAD-dependent deacylase [unclassified Actinoplanes]AEV86416.1 NAD-dependent deacetylase [Actinoplanes sp. SE50/110]ATO84813.1 NAD-dependent deacetylase [Actinoplanes sp. SE50]SLM02223.1 NAD-dependent deacylase [Actinoplanes sp. SE50/110]